MEVIESTPSNPPDSEPATDNPDFVELSDEVDHIAKPNTESIPPTVSETEQKTDDASESLEVNNQKLETIEKDDSETAIEVLEESLQEDATTIVEDEVNDVPTNNDSIVEEVIEVNEANNSTEIVDDAEISKENIEDVTNESDFCKLELSEDQIETQEPEKSDTEEIAQVEANPEITPKKDSSILECIASDWCSDNETEKEGEEEVEDEEVTEVQDPEVSEVPQVTKQDLANKTSAEIIAMDWDLQNESETKPEIESPKKESNVVEPVEQPVEPTPESDVVEDNGLILSNLNLSELKMPPTENNSITIISVDKYPEVTGSETEANESVVLHEIEVEAPPEQDKSVLQKLKKHHEKLRFYPYNICSKEEVRKEISTCTRVCVTADNLDTPSKGDMVLKSNIIKRLASKILPDTVAVETPEKLLKSAKSVPDQELLEILEGDNDIDVYNLEKAETIKPEEPIRPIVTKRQRMKNLDPITEREIALRQLSEIPESSDSMYRKARKGKSNIVVNVPSTIIIDKTVNTDADPFKFEENAKTEGTPNKYGPGGPSSVKTYSRKSVDRIEPNMKEIVQSIPKEILDLEKEHKQKKQAVTKKSPPKPKPEVKKTPETVKKKETVKEPEKKKTPVVKKLETPPTVEKVTPSENILVSKRSRIIKKKIIWDPSLEFQSYVIPASSTTPKPKVQKPKEKTPIIPKKTLKAIGNSVKKELKAKTEKEEEEESDEESETSEEDEESEQSESGKRKSESQTQAKKKKVKLSEVDKLLMDEGAINMLYAVEQDEKVPLIRQKQKVISMDKFDKELSKKKKMIMSALNTTPTSTPKALRRKESPAEIQRKKSRDSLQDPLQASPPPSPQTMFPPRAEASRIIRRHSSSSSFSSECLSPRRLSTVDQSGEVLKPKTENGTGANEFWTGVSYSISENIRKDRLLGRKSRNTDVQDVRSLRKRVDAKKIKYDETEDVNDDTENSADTENNYILGSDPLSDVNFEKSTVTKETPRKTNSSPAIVDEKQRNNIVKNSGNDNYKEITLERSDNYVQLIITPQSSKIKNSLNIQSIKEICDALRTLRKDPTCKLVLITSTGTVFCRGLDYATLIQNNQEKRKATATELANSVGDLIRTIIQFPKPIIAGVQGAVSGVGLSILLVCDLVYASDKSSFTMNQCKLGCIAEGAATVSLPKSAAAKLLLEGIAFKAADALKENIITAVLKDKWYLEELTTICKNVAAKSPQSLEATKLLYMSPLRSNVLAALEKESHLLVQQWTSSECQQLMKKALEQNSW